MVRETLEVSHPRFLRPQTELQFGNKIELQPNGLLKICVNVDMHPNEPFSGKLGDALRQHPLPNVHVYTANELAIKLGRKRYADINMSFAFPGIPGNRPQDAYEHRRAKQMMQFYRENNFDFIFDFHNCATYPNGKSAHMAPRTDGEGLVHENLVVTAGLLGLFNIVLLNEYTFLNLVDNVLSIELPRPTGNKWEKDQAYQHEVQNWVEKFIELGHFRPEQLTFQHVKDFELGDFTFYQRDREISREQAKKLGLEKIVVKDAFEQLPEVVARRLGYREKGYTGPLFAEYWNYNCDAEEVPGTEGEKEWFGSILTYSIVNHLIDQGKEDLVLTA